MLAFHYKRILFFAAAWIAVIVAGPRSGVAHPLGNFSISHYSALRIEPDRIDLRYMIDMAEIPTFQAMQTHDMTAAADNPSAQAYLAQQAEILKSGLHLDLDGQRLDLETVERQIIFPAGNGQLHTMKLGLLYRASLAQIPMAQRRQLHFLDSNFPGRAGWKEVVAAAGPGVAIEQSTVPATDRSQMFSNYPTDLLKSPPQVIEARVVFTHAPAVNAAQTEAPIELQPNQRPAVPQAFAALMTPQALSPGLTLLAFAVAIGLGAFHALEPGHGKSIVAAYLVGSRGTARHALWLGLIVTATHTAGVYMLGAMTLYASKFIVPERLYPWLSIVSGLTIAILGSYLFVQRCKNNEHDHDHRHGHHHSHHHDHSHHHHHSHHHVVEKGDTVTCRQLLALGVTGGMVPCPAALVVLLSAVALQRIGFGLLLIVAFSIGLAAILMAIGLLMVYARRFMARFQGEGVVLTRWLPLTSAGLMTLFGFAMIAQALQTVGVLSP